MITDNEIKKALEICQKPHDNDTCNNCKYKRNFGCRDALCNDILDLINQLETKNSNLTSDLTSLQNNLTSLKAENERLTHITRNLIGEIKAEAYQEFLDKAREKFSECYGVRDFNILSAEFVLENLYKELVGGK